MIFKDKLWKLTTKLFSV